MTTKLMTWSLTFAALAAGTALLQAADALRYVAKPGCVVTIDGDSTIHKWTVKGAIIGGSFEVEPEFATGKWLESVKSLVTKDARPKVEVSIPIRSLKSQASIGASKMDEIMQEAMRATNNPVIKYSLKDMTLKGAVPESGSPVKFDTKGDLAVSGVTNAIEMEVTLERLPDDKIKFSGSRQLKMTDFKIQPPSPKLALGAIKTDDEVVIKFEWVLGPAKAPASAPPAAAK
jgi:polyisoprenoid-binding protein YceI